MIAKRREPQDRLMTILERNRDDLAPVLSSDFVRALGEIEERNQFNDDRLAARQEIRALLRLEVDELLAETEKS